jgi:hypothetical protein
VNLLICNNQHHYQMHGGGWAPGVGVGVLICNSIAHCGAAALQQPAVMGSTHSTLMLKALRAPSTTAPAAVLLSINLHSL